MDFTALKTAIQNAVKLNGNEEITGDILQGVLLSMVNTLGDSAINGIVSALANEVTNRQNADGTLQQNIDAEAQARGNADTALGGRIDGVIESINAINTAIGNGYVYAGIATPSTTPASGKVFYLALTAGTYTNFGSIVVPQGINILKYNGSAWSLDSFLGLDDAPTQGSNNLVKSGGVLSSIQDHGKLLYKGVWLLENHLVNHPSSGNPYVEPDSNYDVLLSVIPENAINVTFIGGTKTFFNYDLFDDYIDFSASHYIGRVTPTTGDLRQYPTAKVIAVTFRKTDNQIGYYDIYPVWEYDKNVALLSDSDSLVPVSTAFGKYFDDVQGERSGHYSLYYKKYSVVGGKWYAFTSHLRGYSVYFVIWLDSSNNIIGHETYRGTNDNTESVDYENKPILAPAGAAYVCVNGQGGEPTIILSEITEPISSKTLKDDIQELIAKVAKQKVLAPTGTRSGFIDTDGTLSLPSSKTWKVKDYNVTGGKYYLFTGNITSGANGIWYLFWYDSNDNPIGGNFWIVSGEGHGLQDALVKAPENASKLSVNTTITFVYDTFIREIVGSPSGYMSMNGMLPSCSLGDVRESGTWILYNSQTYTDLPYDTKVGFLRVSLLDVYVLQEFYSSKGARLFKRRFALTATPEKWNEVTGGGNTYNVTNTFNEYSQTLTVNAMPSITTDTNNFLESTNDNTDRTADILSMLQTTGICRLGPGVFYVDSLVMPDYSALIGSGSKTEVILATGDKKFAIKMGKYNTIKDMLIGGATSAITPSSTIGTRHGILWQGNYTQDPSSGDQPVRYGTIDNVWIKYFSGGGITCYDTGYGNINYISVTNAHIFTCGVGINISYWSEYHKFTNVRCESCWYGCINNGGNNVFVNCDFSSNKGIAFLMDNSQGQSPNNTHGSCVGCVFNHTASNTGIGIKVLNCHNGFVFDGCQIFFSQIYLEDSDGINFSACNFGKNNCNIYVDGGNAILFANDMFEDTPPSIQILNTQSVYFVNCYKLSNGTPVTA